MTTKEEHAVVLDYLQNGYPLNDGSNAKKGAIVQAIGLQNFVLLELVPKKDVHLKSGDQVYVGAGKRDHIHHINGRIPIGKLSNTAQGELKAILPVLININQAKFVEFFNKSQPLSMRMHQLELLPGVGKKHMWEIIEERREPFADFADIKKRVKLLPNPQAVILKRIMKELEGNEKYQLFVKD